MTTVRESRRMAHRWRLLSLATLLALPAISPAQVTTIFNSNGFEQPTFNPGILGSHFSGGTGGQQGFLTTDFSQLLGTPAGNVQSAVTQSGSQAFHIDGTRLFDDQNFAGQTFWYRNFPTPAGAFNPVGNGSPIVQYHFSQHVTSTPLGLSEMPLVGVFMEGYSQAGSMQQVVGSVFFNLNGGLTAITVGGNAVHTANGLVSHDAWHDFQVDFNFTTQTYRTFVDGNLMSFGSGLTNIPFRNTNGVTDRIAEYGFQASYNQSTMSTTNHAYFDGFQVVATGIPEPTSIVLVGAAAGFGFYVRRRRDRRSRRAAGVK
jgi:hypothetical protein